MDPWLCTTCGARTTAVIIRDDTAGDYRLHLVFDGTPAPYLRAVLKDAMAEFTQDPR